MKKKEEEVAQLVPTPIAFEGRLTEAEKKTLYDMRTTELFRIARKLCAQEYSIVCERLTQVSSPNELLSAQGQLLGIKSIFNLLLGAAPSQGNNPEALQNSNKLRNLKSSSV